MASGPLGSRCVWPLSTHWRLAPTRPLLRNKKGGDYYFPATLVNRTRHGAPAVLRLFAVPMMLRLRCRIRHSACAMSPRHLAPVASNSLRCIRCVAPVMPHPTCVARLVPLVMVRLSARTRRAAADILRLPFCARHIRPAVLHPHVAPGMSHLPRLLPRKSAVNTKSSLGENGVNGRWTSGELSRLNPSSH